MTVSAMPSILDRAVRSHDEDAFGHEHYAEALQGLVEDQRHIPPYTVGLLGTWGTGKSTIKHIYDTQLEKDLSKDEGVERRHRIRTIEFNAWRHGNDDIKRALLRRVFIALGGKDEDLHREFFCQVQRVAPERKPLKEFALEVGEKWLIPILAWLVVLLIVGAFGFWIVTYLQLTDLWAGIPITTALGVTAWLLHDVFSVKLQPLSRYTPVTMIQAPSTTAEQYESLLLGQLKAFKTTKKGKACKRIVVFVDDLDRLSAEEMVEGLDAIRVFMDIPDSELPSGCGIVFVVSCDEVRVAEALSRRASRSTDGKIPGTISTLTDARRFLDRIFQFRLEIPPFPRRDMRTYARREIERFPAIVDDLGTAGVTVEQVVGRLMHVGVESPRNALQIVNTFLQTWWIAKKREGAGKSSDRAGALRPKAVTSHPLSQASLCVLKVDFPDFYKRLQLVPELLNAYQRLVFDRCALSDEPLAIQEAIQDFIEVEDQSVIASDRNLRRFLSSVRDVRWPRSIRAMLLLTEDALSRQLGDRADDVHDALVSGDTQGVLEALGRVEDNKLLTGDDVELLKDILSHLIEESDERRDNASVVIADLLSRLPDNESLHLVTRLARNLAESLRLRCRLGVDRIQGILPKATGQDRQTLASILCVDLLRPKDNDWIFTTATGEIPRLNVAVPWIVATCQLGLETWRDVGLNPDGTDALVAWLRHRRVATGSESSDVPFARFDKWYTEFEAILMPSMGKDYAEQVIGQLESQSVDGLDIPTALERLERVFLQMKDAGNQSAARMWEMVSQLAGIQASNGPDFVATFLTAHHQTASSSSFSSCIGSLAARLDKEMHDDKNWSLDWKADAQALLAACEARPSDLEDSAIEQLVKLVTSWASVEDTNAFATRCLELLVEHSPNAVSETIDAFIAEFRSNTKPAIVRWLAQRFADRLSDSQRQALVGQFDHYASSDAISEDEGKQLATFVESLSDTAIKHADLQKPVKRLFSGVAQRFNNAAYLEAVFPSIPHLVDHAPVSTSGPMLSTLFEQTKSIPASYGQLHGWMANHWPAIGDDSYSPETIYNDAAAFGQAQPHQPAAIGVAKSMASMLTAGLVSSDKASELASTACSLWPYDMVESASVLLDLQVTPSPEELAALVEHISPEEKDQVDLLERVWRHAAKMLAADKTTDVGLHLLELDQIEFPIDKKDGALDLWCESAEAHRDTMLVRLVNSESMTDAQRHRTWLKIESIKSEVAAAYFHDVVPPLLVRGDCPDTVAAILRWAKKAEEVFPDASDKATFCDALAPAYFDTPSAETREAIADWISRFHGISAIEQQINTRELTDDQREALPNHFPALKIK